MVHHNVDLKISGTEAYECLGERGENTLYVIHDRETNEGIDTLRKSLIPRRAPDGRHDRILFRVKTDPNADWSP
jgi:hypothetical protein